jgi:TM2 domain-containing membrane protein YozV
MKKDKTLAGILSFVMPGLGQIYVGSVTRGILWFVVYFALLVVAFMTGVMFFFLLIFTGLCIWDAVNEAGIHNKKEA